MRSYVKVKCEGREGEGGESVWPKNQVVVV